MSRIFHDKKITLMGLGVNGGAVEDALFFIKNGARVTVTDVNTKKELEPSLRALEPYENITYVLGRHRKKDFTDTDLVVKNPAVLPDNEYLTAARNARVPVESSYGIFLDMVDPELVIGITGTKGKSTVTALVHHMIHTLDCRPYRAGNIGVSPLKFVDQARQRRGVLELSSWQLEDAAFHAKSPGIALVTNIAEDHINRHGSFAAYRAAKENIFRFQKTNDTCILNYDNPHTRAMSERAPGRVVFFSIKTRPPKSGVYTDTSGAIYAGSRRLGLQGDLPAHIHPENAVAALSVLYAAGFDVAKAYNTLSDFHGLPGRMEYRGSICDTAVYNDTAATNPYATRASLRLMRSHGSVALITGGEDKGLAYNELAQDLGRVRRVVLLPGSASDKIYAEWKQHWTGQDVIKRVASIPEALEEAFAANPDVILFSPAAASFTTPAMNARRSGRDMFANEFERGAAFNAAVERYQNSIN